MDLPNNLDGPSHLPAFEAPSTQPGLGSRQNDPLLSHFNFEMNGEEVPSWAISRGAKSMVDGYMHDDMNKIGYEIKHLKHMGPAVGWGLIFNVVTWSAFISAPFLELASPLLRLSSYLVYAVLALLLKMMAFRFTFPCFLAINGEPEVCNQKLNFMSYGCLMGAGSLASSIDVFTNTVFVNEQSKRSTLDGVGSFKLWLVWGLMLLQPLYVFVHVFVISTVVDSSEVSSTCANTDKGDKGDKDDKNRTTIFPIRFSIPRANDPTAVYSTLVEDTQTHQGAILALAHGGRMKTVVFHWKKYSQRFHSTRKSGNPAFKAMRQHFFHSIVFLLLDSVAFLSLKAEAMTISCANGNCNPVATLGTGLGLVMGVSDVVQSVVSMWSLFEDVLVGHGRWMRLAESEQAKAHHHKFWKEQLVVRNAAFVLVIHSFVAGGCVLGLSMAGLRLGTCL